MLILLADGLRLLCALILQVSNISVEVANSFIKFRDVNILSAQFCTQLRKFLVFIVKLLYKSIKCTFEFFALECTFAELLTQFVNKFSVFLHSALDKANVVLNLFSLVAAFTIFNNRHSVFSLSYESETFLYLIEGSHHVIDFVVTLVNDFLERVILHLV